MIILDIEASGLADKSYPIEIAWQDSADSRKFDAFLISPSLDWDYWDDYAETHIHKISRETLNREGISIGSAANRLNLTLKGMTVYTDAVDYDRSWMNRLFVKADIERQFEMQSIFLLIPPSKEGKFREYMAKYPVSHRALADVRQLISCLNYVAPEGL